MKKRTNKGDEEMETETLYISLPILLVLVTGLAVYFFITTRKERAHVSTERYILPGNIANFGAYRVKDSRGANYSSDDSRVVDMSPAGHMNLQDVVSISKITVWVRLLIPGRENEGPDWINDYYYIHPTKKNIFLYGRCAQVFDQFGNEQTRPCPSGRKTYTISDLHQGPVIEYDRKVILGFAEEIGWLDMSQLEPVHYKKWRCVNGK
jgi:hypothetical protein